MMRFKSNVPCVLFFLCIPWTSMGQSGSPVQLSIATESPAVKKGAEIKLHLTLKNVSDSPVDFYSASGAGGGKAENDNGIYVRDASGKLLPRIDGRTVMRADGKAIRMRPGLPSRKMVTLNPGEEFRDYAILSNLFDLTTPGTYSVNVAQDIRLDHASPEPTLAVAKSNTIQVTVVGSAGP